MLLRHHHLSGSACFFPSISSTATRQSVRFSSLVVRERFRHIPSNRPYRFCDHARPRARRARPATGLIRRPFTQPSVRCGQPTVWGCLARLPRSHPWLGPSQSPRPSLDSPSVGSDKLPSFSPPKLVLGERRGGCFRMCQSVESCARVCASLHVIEVSPGRFVAETLISGLGAATFFLIGEAVR